MDNYLSIFQGILSTKGAFLDIYLNGLKDHRKFCAQSKDSGDLVQHISSLLTKSDTRLLGICLLESFIDDCPIDIFEQRGNLWTTLVLKSCSNHDFHLEAHLIFDILEKIVKKSQQSPDFSKVFASTYLCKIYESLENVSLPNVKYALKCIETCLRVYPSTSGPYRGIIDRFLSRNVMSNDEEVVQGCGKCLHLLQQVKGGGALGINYKTQWKNYQLQLIGGLHSVYNEMFANCAELYEDKVETEKLPWDNTDQFNLDMEPVKKAAQLYTRCHNLIKYLVLALREPFPVEKPIFLKKILNIINRGLSVNCIMLEQNPIADNIALSILLPKLHVDLFELLTALMSILPGQIRLYSEFVLGLVVEAIKWTSAKNAKGDQKVLQKLRAKVYETLSRWCKIFHSGNRVDTISEFLFQQILNDITPIQNEFTLKVLSGARKHMSKKARRQLHNLQNEKSNMVQTHSNDSNYRNILSEELNQELCISALRCLQNILFSSCNFIKPTIVKSIHLHVTRICAMLCEHPPKLSIHLYSNKICRIEVYNTLYAILMTPHVLCPPPTEIAFAVLRTAFMRDPSLKVRLHCNILLQNLEKLIHPQKESLLFTIDARDIRNTFIKHGQESLMYESSIKFSSELLNVELEYDSNEDEPPLHVNENKLDMICETNSTNDNQNGKSEESSQTNDIDSLQNHFNSPDVQIDNNKPINECDMDAYKDANIIEFTNERKPNNCKLSMENANIVPTKSPELVLRVEGDRKTTIGENVSTDKECSDEPISKKQKFDKEVELNENETDIDSGTTKFSEDEDTVVADIVSQFVDELD